jgi:hypothetical protein
VKAGFRVEPPIGIEPMTYALRGARSLSAHALAAPIAPIIALTALAALRLSAYPVHEPVHARCRAACPPITVRNFTECIHPRWDYPSAPFHEPFCARSHVSFHDRSQAQ